MLDTAAMITADAARGAAIRLSTTFELARPANTVVSAALEATAHGVYEFHVDGHAVTDSVLNPGWTSYEWRLQVQRFDITTVVAAATTPVLLSATLGNGWWRGDFGFDGSDANYGDDLGLAAEITIAFADGTTQIVATDPTWVATTSEITANSIYNGQTIDARARECAGEALATRETALDRSTLVAQTGPLIKRQETRRPTDVLTTPSGKIVLDFGQNLVGWLRITAQGERGSSVVVRHAEVLEDGELGVRPLRGARATDTFILSGAEDTFEPTFTFHGFRYAEVTGLSPAEAANIEAVVVHSEMARTGWFECSHPAINQLVQNSVWGQKGNFLDVPTDCPQRDERLGWTGDIAVYAPTAAFQFDVADLLHKWLLDVDNETRAAGAVPLFVPQVMKHAVVKSRWDEGAPRPFAVWSDAAAWVPFALWEAYGDRDRLAEHYPIMTTHIETVLPRLDDDGVWASEFQLGDWLDPDAAPDNPAGAKADPGVVATAAFHRTLAMTADAARTLGLADDATRWAELADRVRAGFVARFVADDGTITSDCATVYAVAIMWGLLDATQSSAAGNHLARIVAEADYRVTTGFAGTPYVTWALSETGHVAEAYRLLLEERLPSWLYPVSMGATTIWERWDSMLPDGSINQGDMTSFNHYALGSVADWLYKVVAGIHPASPGYASVRLAPTPGPGLDWAKASLDTARGRIECGWRRTAVGYEVTTRIPEGIAAELVLPDGTTVTPSSGEHTFVSA